METELKDDIERLWETLFNRFITGRGSLKDQLIAFSVALGLLLWLTPNFAIPKSYKEILPDTFHGYLTLTILLMLIFVLASNVALILANSFKRAFQITTEEIVFRLEPTESKRASQRQLGTIFKPLRRIRYKLTARGRSWRAGITVGNENSTYIDIHYYVGDINLGPHEEGLLWTRWIVIERGEKVVDSRDVIGEFDQDKEINVDIQAQNGILTINTKHNNEICSIPDIMTDPYTRGKVSARAWLFGLAAEETVITFEDIEVS